MNKNDWGLMIAFFDFFWFVLRYVFPSQLGRSHQKMFDSCVGKVNDYLDKGHR